MWSSTAALALAATLQPSKSDGVDAITPVADTLCVSAFYVE
jgi:hypothetical protein